MDFWVISMLDQGQLIEIEEAAMRGKTFSSDVVLALMEIIAELEENAAAQSLALKAAKAMQQAETERADANERDAGRYRWLLANYARGDGWQEIDDALNDGEADTKLSPSIDRAMRNL